MFYFVRKCSQSFFRSQYWPKKTRPRQASSISSLHRDLVQAASRNPPPLPSVRVKLGPEDVTCKEGSWVGKEAKEKCRPCCAFIKLKKTNQSLVQDNFLLQLKNDILLDMLVDAKAEIHMQEIEIKQLKSCLAKKFH